MRNKKWRWTHGLPSRGSRLLGSVKCVHEGVYGRERSCGTRGLVFRTNAILLGSSGLLNRVGCSHFAAFEKEVSAKPVVLHDPQLRSQRAELILTYVYLPPLMIVMTFISPGRDDDTEAVMPFVPRWAESLMVTSRKGHNTVL